MNNFLSLGKPQITLPISLSALTGYFLYTASFSWDWLPSIAGVFLMSFASSAINQIQDADLDSRMERTRRRPIPSGRVRPLYAGIMATGAAVAGFLLLWLTHPSSLPAWLSLFTLACYNLVYTPLKRISAFAVFPGALVGALPPIIGWVAAGGSPLHLHIIFVGCFFFIGQIPHFWLILLTYDKDYRAAGLPTLLQLFSLKQIRSMTVAWVAATAMTGLLLLLSGVITNAIISLLVMMMTLMLLVAFRKWLTANSIPKPGSGFMAINLYYLAMMVLLIADALVR